MQISNQFPTLKRLVDRHEKRVAKFQSEASKLFHPHAVTLCRRIQKEIPKFTGCMLAMRHLYLEPGDLDIGIIDGLGEHGTEKLRHIIDYITIHTEYTVKLSEQTKQALMELDELANYIDDNYSNVDELHVDLTKK